MYAGIIDNKLKGLQQAVLPNGQYDSGSQQQGPSGAMGIVGRIQNAMGPSEEEIALKQQLALEQNNRNNPNSGYSR